MRLIRLPGSDALGFWSGALVLGAVAPSRRPSSVLRVTAHVVPVFPYGGRQAGLVLSGFLGVRWRVWGWGGCAPAGSAAPGCVHCPFEEVVMDLAGVVAAGRKARADALALPGMAGRSEDELLLASNHPDLMCPCDLCPPDNYLVHDEDLVDLDVPCARFVAPTTLCPCGCGYVVPLYDNGTRGFCDDLPF